MVLQRGPSKVLVRSNCFRFLWLLVGVLACAGGCQANKQNVAQARPAVRSYRSAPDKVQKAAPERDTIQLAAYRQTEALPQPSPSAPIQGAEPIPSLAPNEAVETLEQLEGIAIATNPRLRRMQQEAAAEWAQTGYIAKLPDPTISSMFYVPPMNFEPDRQVSEVQVMQMIPWLGRLSAEAKQAHLEALAAQTEYDAERIRVVGEIRSAWFKLYVLQKQVETTEAEKAQLESLLRTATARVATGDAQPGDVLMASLELSNLQEQLLSYRQQIAATAAEVNRLVGRDARIAISPPRSIMREVPRWDHELLKSVAFSSQPELNAARLRIAATRWGIEVARLKRRPDITVSGGWVAMDAPGAMMPGAGRDSYTLGVSTTLPIWHKKYDAMVAEASSEHFAAHATEDEIMQRLDASLVDLWEQVRASQQTVELYETTILPQARQTFEADQQSLANGTVTFDRVIRDYRTLLNLQLGYHRALGQLAMTLAKIRQTVGVDLIADPEPLPQRPAGQAVQ